jgi:hypothetical protein
MIHVGQNIIDVLGSSMVWGLLAVFAAQTDLATSPAVAHGKDVSPSSMDMTKIQGFLKDMVSATSGIVFYLLFSIHISSH